MQTTCRECLLAILIPKQHLSHVWHSASWIRPDLNHGPFQIFDEFNPEPVPSCCMIY